MKEWYYPDEHPFRARNEAKECRVNGLSGYKMKELDDKIAKVFKNASSDACCRLTVNTEGLSSTDFIRCVQNSK